MQGKVYLIGAGPGDPGLLTVRGLERLKEADVLIYDHLVDESLLDQARPGTEMIYVGKTAKRHAREQDEINLLLVEKAGEGKTVARLKGGDPFVLGRGGEEAEALAGANITFEVVPGVSSATAVPAYAGIPVSHRGIASSFAVITGHEDPTKETSSIAWDKLAGGVDTLVFLMGVANLPQIVGKLLEHGRPPSEPVALIKDGTGPEQTTVVGTLDNIVNKAEGIAPPAVIVVGGVVGLRERLRWFDKRPLFGKRVLVTRARPQARSLSRLLSERGAFPVEMPVIDIQRAPATEELEKAILGLEAYDWVLFTSVNGVYACFERLHDLGLDSRQLKGVRIGAIGPATAEALSGYGIRPDLLAEPHTSAGLLEGLERTGVADQRFLLPRADIADVELSQGLLGLGAEVHEVTAYRTLPTDESSSKGSQMLLEGKIDVITFTSSSTVANLVESLEGDAAVINRAILACIGPKTAATARERGLRVDIEAGESTIPGLVEAIEVFFRDRERRHE